MKKLLAVVLVAVMCFGGGFAWAGIASNDITDADGNTDISVESTGVVITTYFITDDADSYAISYKGASAAGNPRFTVQLQQSSTVPTTDGVAEPASWSTPNDVTDVVTGFAGTESVWYHEAFTPVAMKYGRFAITGTTGNHATDTVVNLKLHKKI